MTKSTIGKKSALNNAQKTFADFGIKYISNWTKKELKKFITQPVVIPFGNYGFFVGPFTITGIHSDCWRVVSDTDTRFQFDFTNKSSAILYCLLEVQKKYSAAREILELDDKLGRLDMDVKNYEVTIIKAKKSNNLTKVNIFLNRYINAKLQRKTYAKILKKTINSAKYFKFGNY